MFVIFVLIFLCHCCKIVLNFLVHCVPINNIFSCNKLSSQSQSALLDIFSWSFAAVFFRFQITYLLIMVIPSIVHFLVLFPIQILPAKKTWYNFKCTGEQKHLNAPHLQNHHFLARFHFLFTWDIFYSRFYVHAEEWWSCRAKILFSQAMIGMAHQKGFHNRRRGYVTVDEKVIN